MKVIRRHIIQFKFGFVYDAEVYSRTVFIDEVDVEKLTKTILGGISWANMSEFALMDSFLLWGSHFFS